MSTADVSLSWTALQQRRAPVLAPFADALLQQPVAVPPLSALGPARSALSSRELPEPERREKFRPVQVI